MDKDKQLDIIDLFNIFIYVSCCLSIHHQIWLEIVGLVGIILDQLGSMIFDMKLSHHRKLCLEIGWFWSLSRLGDLWIVAQPYIVLYIIGSSYWASLMVSYALNFLSAHSKHCITYDFVSVIYEIGTHSIMRSAFVSVHLWLWHFKYSL